MRRKPWSVVLFDEIEKAHEDVWGLLLQIMEDGRLTDSAGRRADFRNTIVVMTSNVGAKAITDDRPALGFEGAGERDGEAEAKSAVMKELKQTFRPEFLNRVDDIIMFRRLGRDQVKQIVGRMTDALTERMSALGVELTVTDRALRALAEAGYDPAYGARPLRRAVSASIEDAAADMLLSGELRPGDKAEADEADGRVAITVTDRAQPAVSSVPE